MRLRLFYIFSLLVLSEAAVFAQQADSLPTGLAIDTLSIDWPPKDTVAVPDVALADTLDAGADSTKRLLAYFAIDYGKALLAISPFETKFEFGLGAIFPFGLGLHINAGTGEIAPRHAYESTDYQSRGNYVKAGLSLTTTNTSKNLTTIGLNFGHSRFEDQYSFSLQDTTANGLFKTPYVVPTVKRSNLSANWLELVLSTERRVNKILSLGTAVSLRYLLNYDSFETIDVYSIPGYGRSLDKTTPAATLFLRIYFPNSR